MRGFSSDVRYACRTLKRGGVSTAIALLSLAIGVGANTTLFSVADAMLIHALPYPNADRLVMLRPMNPSHGVLWTTAAPANLLDWRAQAKSFEAIAGYRWWTTDLTGGGGRSERLRGLRITPEFFKVLDVPLLGHTFELENAPQPKAEMVIGRGLWQRRFASDPGLLGRSIDVNIINLARVGPTPFSVVGIALADVHFPPLSADYNLDVAGIGDSVDFWGPEALNPTRRDNGDLDVIARLRPGVSLEQAQAEMDTISRNLATAHPDTNNGLIVRVVALRDQVLGGSRRVLWLLFACTASVLLVACGNVVHLLLALAAARQRDVAIRVALGAGRHQIARQFLTESGLLALAAGVAGIGLAYGSLLVLRPLIPASVPLAQNATVDITVLFFTLAIVLLTAVMAGLVPAFRLESASLDDAMKLEGRSSTASRGRRRVVAILVATEVATTLVLSIVTGLMVKSANELSHIDPGFDTQNLLTMTISLPSNKFEWRHNVVFSRDVMRSLESLPEIRDTAVIQGVPMRAGSFYTSFSVEGQPVLPVEQPSARLRVVSPGYFRVMRIPVLAGRDYDERDEIGEVGSLPSVIINRTLAERFWPGQDAIGRKIRMSWKNTPSVVIGVVGDVRYTGLDEAAGNEFYLPEGLYPQAAITLLLRTTRNPLELYPEIHRRIEEIDRDAFVFDVEPMTQLIAESLSARRFSTLLLSMFAVIALILSLAGIYAVIAHAVAQRTMEIGIRAALGASTGQVIRPMLRDGLVPAIGGMIVGWLSVLTLARFFSAMLFDVGVTDPSIWILVSSATLAAAALASYLPARRACAVDPAVALRAQ